MNKAKKIVETILDDMTDRGGLSGVWDMIDDDIQEEIKETWVKLVEKILKK